MRTVLLAYLLVAFLLPWGHGASASPHEAEISHMVEDLLVSMWGEGMVMWERSSEWRLDGIPASAELELVQPDDPPRGSTALILDVAMQGRTFRRIPLSIRVYAFAWVPVSTRSYTHHQEIDLRSVRWEKQEVTRLRRDWPSTHSDLIAHRWWTRRPVEEGDVLTYSVMEERPQVIRGEQVALVVQRRGVTVCAPGIALDTGRIGERIRVENSLSGIRLRGKVSDILEVEVDGPDFRHSGSRR